MNSPQQVTIKPQLALQSYLDGLLQEATEELQPLPQAVAERVAVAPAPVVVTAPEAIDEFQAAVLEEQARDARLKTAAPAFAEPTRLVMPVMAPPVVAKVVEAASVVAPVIADVPTPVEPLVQVHLPAAPDQPVPPLTGDGRPAWAAEPFECLLFDVAGLTLAVPLVCLGSIYSLAGQELTPLFGQPEWFLGILPSQAGNLKVLDTARWVMPDRYRDDFARGCNTLFRYRATSGGWRCIRSAARCAWTRARSSGAASVGSARGLPVRSSNTCARCWMSPSWQS